MCTVHHLVYFAADTSNEGNISVVCGQSDYTYLNGSKRAVREEGGSSNGTSVEINGSSIGEYTIGT